MFTSYEVVNGPLKLKNDGDYIYPFVITWIWYVDLDLLVYLVYGIY